MAGQVLIKVLVDPSNAYKGIDAISKKAKRLERDAVGFNIRTAAAQSKQARISETFLGQRAKALREEIKLNRAAFQESRKRVEDYKKLTGVQESLRQAQIAKEEAFQKSILKSNKALSNGLLGYKNLEKWDQRLGAEKAAWQQRFASPFQTMRRGVAGRMDKINAAANGFYFNMANMQTLVSGFKSAFEFISPGRDYEKTMRSVEAVAAKGAILDDLRNVVKQLGGSTPLTTNQNAEAALQFAKAGFTPKQIEQMLPGTINMALATDTSPEEAVKHAASTISMFEMSASKMGEVADMYTKAMLTSPTDMTDLAYAMRDAAPAMHVLNQSFRDTLGMIAELGQNGLKGSKAGNSIKRIAIRLSKPTKEVYEAIDEINAYNKGKGKAGVWLPDPDQFKVNGKFSLSGYLKRIDQATKGLDAMTKNKLNAKLFGAYGLSGGAILTRAAGNGALATRYLKLNQSRGAAEETARQRQDNLEGDIKKFESGYEALRISVFDAVNKLLRSGIQYATQLVNKMTEWANKNPEIIASLAKWGAYLGGALVAITAIGAAASLLSVALNGCAMVLGVMTSTWGSIAIFASLAVTYAIAANTNLEKTNGLIFDITNGLYENSDTFKLIVDYIDSMVHKLDPVIDKLKTVFEWLQKIYDYFDMKHPFQEELETFNRFEDPTLQAKYQKKVDEAAYQSARVAEQVSKAKKIVAYRASLAKGQAANPDDLDWQSIQLDPKVIENIKRGQTALQALSSHSASYESTVKATAKTLKVSPPQPQAITPQNLPTQAQNLVARTQQTIQPATQQAITPQQTIQPAPQVAASAPQPQAITPQDAESLKQAISGSAQVTNNLSVNVQGPSVSVHCDASSIQTFVQEVVNAAKPLINNIVNDSAKQLQGLAAKAMAATSGSPAAIATANAASVR